MALTRATLTQREAASPTTNVWVSASAGSGKTKVLTDRVLTILLTGTPPQRILCLTFTKAAAAEMANRIRDRLGEWVVMEDGALFEHLHQLTGVPPSEESLALARRLFERTLNTPGGLKIQTLHGFCQSVLKRFPLEAGLSPHFQVLDESGAQKLLKESLDRILQKAPAPKLAQSLEQLSHLFHEEGFWDLTQTLLQDRGRLRTLYTRGIASALAQITLYLETPPASDREVVEKFLPLLEDLRDVGVLLQEGTPTDQERGRGIVAGMRAETIDTYGRLFLTEKGEIRARLMTQGLAKKYPEALERLERQGECLLRLEEKRKNARIARHSSAIVTYGWHMYGAYEAAKKSQESLDYDDLIAHTVALLEQKSGALWVLYKLDGGVDHILIDEAQDTSPDQWRIIKALTDQFFEKDQNRSLFVVGDEKQSIYSFQGADPKAFTHMQEHFSALSLAHRRTWKSLALDVSFRSTREVLQVVDAIFEEPHAQKGVSPHKIHHLPFRQGSPGTIEIWPLCVKKEVAAPAPWTPPLESVDLNSPRTELARRMACQIQEWLTTGRILPAKGRPVEPKDILILVRKRGAFVEELIRFLKDKDVPVAGVDRMVLLDQLAVKDLMALGEFLLLPEDDLTLATVLKGPLVGLGEDDLFTLAYNRGKTSLWRRLAAASETSHIFKNAYDLLVSILGQVDYLTPHGLFSHTMGPLGGHLKWAERLGRDAKDSLEEFLNLTLQYEESHIPSLQGFIHWMKHETVELKRDLDQSQDIRIMTVHGSKGLQAPIVFLPDTTTLPTLREAVTPLEDTYLWLPPSVGDTPQTRSLKMALKTKQEEEYRRLFYVALTRAEDEIYIGGWSNQESVPEGSWYQMARRSIEPLAQPFEDDRGQRGWRHGGSLAEISKTFSPSRSRTQESPLLPHWVGTHTLPESLPKKGKSPSALDRKGSAQDQDLEEGMRHLSPRTSLGALKRGVLIHRLLEILPRMDPRDHGLSIEQFLKTHGCEALEIREITLQIQTLFETFPALFSKPSQSEVPLGGLVDGVSIEGQMDRLIVEEDVVTVIDFKTTRLPPLEGEPIPEAYLHQMSLYRRLLEKIYPGHTIRCGLLWTSLPRLDILDPNV